MTRPAGGRALGRSGRGQTGRSGREQTGRTASARSDPVAPWHPAALRVLAVLACLACAGCGAGVITAALLGSRSGDEPPPPATITLSQPFGPLSIDADEFYVRRAVLRNVAIAADADLEVRLAATVGGAVVEVLQTLLLVERGSSEVSVGFALRTDEIEAAVGDPTASDVQAELRVRVPDGSGVRVFSAPFLLLRQPVLELVPNDPVLDASVVSVLGDELELSVAGLPTRDARDLTVEVVTGDPNPPSGAPAVLLRRATNIRTEPGSPDPSLTTVRCTVPASSIPTQAFVRVVHVTAGRSTIVTEVYYRPELTAVVSRRGAVRGGELVSLTGQGIVPFDFGVSPPQPAFSNVQVFFGKGGRETAIGPADLRPSLSSANTVVFVTPPSPDGRPGPVTVRLRVTLPVPVDVERDGLFAYGATASEIGPRGFALDAGTVATSYGARSATAGPDRPVDAAVVAPDASGVPVVRVLESLGNGCFTQLGLPVRAGDRSDLDQRFPLDLVWGAFRDDAWRDVLVVNRGTVRSAHTVLRGRDDPTAPLRFSGVGFRTGMAPVRAHTGPFDDDPRDDVLVAGAENAHQTTEYATASAAGVFTTRRVFPLPVARVDASQVGDLDGDGFADLMFAVGGASAAVRVAFGEPGPLFGDSRVFDLSAIPELTAGAVVGVHAVGPGPDRSLALVANDDTGGGDPSIVLLAPTAPREYGAVHQVVPLGGGGDAVRSLGADLDADGVDELVLARDGAGLALLVWDGATLVVRPQDAVGLAPEDTGRVFDLDAGPAVDAARGGRTAVFVAHEAPLPEGPTPRLTVLLAAPGPALLDPVAARSLTDPPRAVALGAFSDVGNSGSDLVVALDGRLDVHRNDGVGELEFEHTVGVLGLVPATVVSHAVRSGGARDRVAFVLDDGRAGVWSRAAGVELTAGSLFAGLGTVRSATRVVVDDVDGDGWNDLVVLLVVEPAVGGGLDRSLLLLRGRDAAAGTFPFVVPSSAARTPIDADAVDLAVGDLAPRSGDGWLEAALAVGRADEVQRGIAFFRVEPGTAADGWRFVPSFVDPEDPRVASGFDPALVRVSDVDADGFDDLVVVSASLDAVQVFRQTRPSARAPDSGEVDPLVFALAADRALPAGSPQDAHLADLDGDGLDDVVLQIRARADPDRHEVVVAVSNGLGGFADGFELPGPHVGTAGPDLVTTVGDVNGDAVPDLALGWSGDGLARAPELRLLFGTHL